jgi:hypothetical protein
VVTSAAAQRRPNPSLLPALSRAAAEPLGGVLLGLPHAVHGYGACGGDSMSAIAALVQWRARGGWVKVLPGETELAFMSPSGECPGYDLLDIMFAAEAELLAVLLAEEQEIRRRELIELADALRGCAS